MTVCALRALVLAHAERYPKAQVQDYAKLLYQAQMGPGHLVEDSAASLKRLEEEWHGSPRLPGLEAFEAIGGGFSRAHLAAFPRHALPQLNAFFVEAARHKGDLEVLSRWLGVLAQLIRAGELPLEADAALDWLDAYRAGGMPAARHSPAYREAYHPAYRVVGEGCVAAFSKKTPQ